MSGKEQIDVLAVLDPNPGFCEPGGLLRERALEIASVCAVVQSLRQSGKPSAEAEEDRKEAIRAFDVLLADSLRAVDELIKAAREMNRLAKGPEGGVSMADKRAIVARMDAALANIGATTP